MGINSTLFKLKTSCYPYILINIKPIFHNHNILIISIYFSIYSIFRPYIELYCLQNHFMMINFAMSERKTSDMDL